MPLSVPLRGLPGDSATLGSRVITCLPDKGVQSLEVIPSMDDPQRYLDPVALAKVRNLELQARLIVEGYLSGMHKSPYHGFSVEFAQHREYVAGDDLKHLDWKVFSRTGRFYLKQYEEETNLACLDARGRQRVDALRLRPGAARRPAASSPSTTTPPCRPPPSPTSSCTSRTRPAS